MHSLLKNNIHKYKIPIELYNPVVAPISKIKNNYRWRIIAKCTLNNSIVNFVNSTLEDYYKLKIKNIRIIADVNPNSMN